MMITVWFVPSSPAVWSCSAKAGHPVITESVCVTGSPACCSARTMTAGGVHQIARRPVRPRARATIIDQTRRPKAATNAKSPARETGLFGALPSLGCGASPLHWHDRYGDRSAKSQVKTKRPPTAAASSFRYIDFRYILYQPGIGFNFSKTVIDFVILPADLVTE